MTAGGTGFKDIIGKDKVDPRIGAFIGTASADYLYLRAKVEPAVLLAF